MRVSLPRIISLILLLIALLTLSGLTTAAAALVHADTATACCDKERNDGEKPGDVPCSAPDCSCLSCMTIDLIDSPTIHRSSVGEAPHYTPAQRFHLSEYVGSIDYPPEIP